MVFAFTNQKKKSTLESVENPATLRKTEKDVHVFVIGAVLCKCVICSEREFWSKERSSDWRERIVPQFTPDEWKENFRVCPETFKYLCHKIRPELCKKSAVMRTPISVEWRVAITLWRLVMNIDYRSIGHLFRVGRCTACSIVNEVCTVIVQRRFKQYISIPSGDILDEVVEGFADVWGFLQCAGPVDGSHIAIQAPSECAKDYYNCKGFHSILV